MVKMSGRTRSAGHLKQHLDYVTRNGKLRAETSDGHVIEGRDGIRHVHDDWLAANQIFQRGKPRPDAAQSVGLVLSMPPGADPDRLQDAARAWAHATLTGKYDWLMVRHDDRDHPHCHVTVRAVGQDGKRFAPSREQMQAWREGFAQELRRRGVEAEATPRMARGQAQRRQHDAIHHMRKRGQEPRPPPRPKVDGTAEKAAWMGRIDARQTAVRAAYLAHAAELAKGGSDERRMARDVERYVANMSVAQARRQELERELRHVREQLRSR
jgi:hypothetical protein